MARVQRVCILEVLCVSNHDLRTSYQHSRETRARADDEVDLTPVASSFIGGAYGIKVASQNPVELEVECS